jgi:hypothetical protein
MIITSRISSGFDIELQLGSRWFFTALNLMNENGLLTPPEFPVELEYVKITFEPEWDLEIKLVGNAIPVFASAKLSDDGTELVFNTNIPIVGEKRIPFGALKGMAEPPVLTKLSGDADHEDVICILANLNIHAEPQSAERLPEGEILERGNIEDAQSFLPLDKDIAFGMGKATFPRFANNIWHTNLRAADGTHPLPDAENKKGDWSSVSMKPEGGKIRIKLEGDIPADSPLIDIIPDPHVTITLILTPDVKDGKLIFTMETETDVDMGLLGDLFGGVAGGIVGAIVGLIVGLVTGGILIAILVGAGIGFVLGVIIIEVGEVIVEGLVQNELKAKLEGEELPEVHCCKTNIVNIAKPSGNGFNISIVDAIPTSIPIYTENPENEFLYKRSLLVTTVYDDMEVNSDGFGATGMSGTGEKFQPEVVSIINAKYESEQLVSLTYRRNDGKEQELPIEEVFARAQQAELKAPFRIFQQPDDSMLRIPEGKLACACLKPAMIKQEDTIVEEIQFENGVKLRVPDAIALQDAAAIVVTGYQLIHPKDYNAYYRAKADFFKDNNFESLDKYD